MSDGIRATHAHPHNERDGVLITDKDCPRCQRIQFAWGSAAIDEPVTVFDKRLDEFDLKLEAVRARARR